MQSVRFIGPERHMSDVTVAEMGDLLTWISGKMHSKGRIAVDTETSGLDFISDRMVMLQLGDSAVQWAIDTRYVDISPLREVFLSKDVLKVFHNAKFDLCFLLAKGITCNNVACTMLQEIVLTCGLDMSYSLKNVVKRRLNVDLNKDERLSFTNLEGKPFTDAQIIYGAKDVGHLLELYDMQQSELVDEWLFSTGKLENNAVLSFADIEFEGMGIDVEAWRALNREYREKFLLASKALDEMLLSDPIFKPVLPRYIQGDLFDEPKRSSTEWTSPQQALKVFRCIIPELESADSKKLYLHRTKHPIILEYIKFKEMQKVVSSYGEKFLEARKADGKVHTRFRQILNTGRVSSSDPNMQQIPGDNRFRNCFTAPEGWVFVSSDYSSQELNVIAFGSKDPVWIDALEKGHDLHSVCADLVYKDRWKEAAEPDCVYMEKKQKCDCKGHKKLRTQIKSVNFGLAYGMSPQKLSDVTETSLSEAKQTMEEYFKAFPAIRKYLEGLGSFGVSKGYSMTFPPFRRKRFYPGWRPHIRHDEGARSLVGSIERASKNHPIQGSSADMTKLALHFIREEIMEHDLPVKLVMTVHDQIDTICKKEFAEEWAQRLTQLMEKAALKVITNGLLKAETTISERWTK